MKVTKVELGSTFGYLLHQTVENVCIYLCTIEIGTLVELTDALYQRVCRSRRVQVAQTFRGLNHNEILTG